MAPRVRSAAASATMWVAWISQCSPDPPCAGASGGQEGGPGPRRPARPGLGGWGSWSGGAGLVGPRADAPALVTLSEHGNPYSGKIGVLITGLFRIALMAYLTLYRNPGSGAAQMAGTGRAGAVCGARRTGGTAAARAAGEGLAAPRRERPGPAPGTPPRAPGGAGVITPVAAAGRSPWVRPAATVRGAHTPGGAARRPPARPAAVTAGDLPSGRPPSAAREGAPRALPHPGRHVQMPAIDRQFLRSGSNNQAACDNTSDYVAYQTIFEE